MFWNQPLKLEETFRTLQQRKYSLSFLRIGSEGLLLLTPIGKNESASWTTVTFPEQVARLLGIIL